METQCLRISFTMASFVLDGGRLTVTCEHVDHVKNDVTLIFYSNEFQVKC